VGRQLWKEVKIWRQLERELSGAATAEAGHAVVFGAVVAGMTKAVEEGVVFAAVVVVTGGDVAAS
jgi:hypothetical protein